MREGVSVTLLAGGHAHEGLLERRLRGEEERGADAARLAVVVADAEVRLLGHVGAFDVRRVHAVDMRAGDGSTEKDNERQPLHGVTTSTMLAPSLA